MTLSKRRALTDLILLSLEKAVDGFVRVEDFYKHGHLYSYDRPLKKAYLALAFKRLREKGLVKSINNEQLIFGLTDKGKDKAMMLSLQENNFKWDGKWRIVIFDIPEKRKVARELLRSKLKSWGFEKWQQSVWVTKKDCLKPFKKFISEVGIKNWVKVLEADLIDL